MRKSTAITMVIIIFSLLAMMLAADLALKPMKHVLRVGQELTAALEAREDIRRGTKVVTVARLPEDRHLAKEGWGMIISLEPSDLVLKRKGRLHKLALRVAQLARRLYGEGKGKRLQWFEIQMTVAAGIEKRTLLPIDDMGRIGAPVPALPATFPELAKAPAAPRRPAPKAEAPAATKGQ